MFFFLRKQLGKNRIYHLGWLVSLGNLSCHCCRRGGERLTAAVYKQPLWRGRFCRNVCVDFGVRWLFCMGFSLKGRRWCAVAALSGRICQLGALPHWARLRTGSFSFSLSFICSRVPLNVLYLSADWRKHVWNLSWRLDLLTQAETKDPDEELSRGSESVTLNSTYLKNFVLDLEASFFVSWTFLHNLGDKDPFIWNAVNVVLRKENQLI